MSYFDDLWDEFEARDFQGDLEDCHDFSHLATEADEILEETTTPDEKLEKIEKQEKN